MHTAKEFQTERNIYPVLQPVFGCLSFVFVRTHWEKLFPTLVRDQLTSLKNGTSWSYICQIINTAVSINIACCWILRRDILVLNNRFNEENPVLIWKCPSVHRSIFPSVIPMWFLLNCGILNYHVVPVIGKCNFKHSAIVHLLVNLSKMVENKLTFKNF